jgi:hypothetical protein
MAFVIQFAAKGVATGIGLASEGIHAHKEKKRAKKLAESESAMASDSESSANLAHEASKSNEHMALTNRSLEGDHEDYEGDEVHWKLDEVQEEIQPSTPEEKKDSEEKKKKNERNIVVVINEFVCKYPSPSRGSGQNLPLRNLALPVILPQRRPKGRARGFIRAYSPVLMDCGIDQPMFIDFLDTFNQATQASPWIQLLNLAGLAPLPIGFSVLLQVAITITIKAATEVQGRSRYEHFHHMRT